MTYEEVCGGGGEWFVCVTSPVVATLEDRTPPPDGTPDEDLFFPLCYRDAGEIKAVAE